jgi:nucleotide-binding universal stress UspA family protein
MLVTVHPDPLVVLPSGMNWKSLHEEAEKTLAETRATQAPRARTVVETDISTARALHRVVRREHRDLLVLGSSRRGTEGHVRIGKRTRQLLCKFECPLALAPLGLHKRAPVPLRKVGVGYDASLEAQAALALAGSIALAAGAELRVRAVVDDRVPVLARGALDGLVSVAWTALLGEEEQRLREQCEAVADASEAEARVDVLRGRPADALLELSEQVDLLVIGSRRWGPDARVLLGSTGEALLHDAACAMVAVPRPRTTTAR